MTSGDSFETMCQPERLRAAWARVRANGAVTGGDGETASAFAGDLAGRLARLRSELIAGRYRPGPLRRVAMHRPDGRVRILRIPGIADRVVQTACQKLLSEQLDGRMSAESFAYRPARSVTHALARLRVLAEGQAWALDADIASFFDRVPHGRLLDEFGIWIDDPRIAALVALWLRSFGGGQGLAQGAPISPVLANLYLLYLHPLDTTLARQGIPFVRYADDFIALGRDRPGVERARLTVDSALRRRGLALAPAKTRIVPLAAGLTFLGQQLEFSGSRRGGDGVRPATL